MNPQEIRSLAYKMAAKYALLMGLFLLVRFASEIAMKDNSWVTIIYLITTVGIPFFAYFLGKKYVKQTNEPVVKYGDFYSFTFFLFVFSSLILCLGQYIFYQFLSPQYLNEMYDVTMANIDLLLPQYPSLNEYQKLLLESPMPSPLQMATQSIWLYSILGIFLGLINAAIYRFWSKTNNH